MEIAEACQLSLICFPVYKILLLVSLFVMSSALVVVGFHMGVNVCLFFFLFSWNALIIKNKNLHGLILIVEC